MPRPPDAELEERIVAAAMRLLDRGGEAAVTLRAVAKEGGTTTPTLYKRFRNRDELRERLVGRATDEVMAALESATSIEAMFRGFLEFSRARPTRVSLSVQTFGERYVRGEMMPGFELLQTRIRAEVGIKGKECEDLALAIASLGFGTAQGMIAAGNNTRHAAQFRRTAIGALRSLVAAFSRRKGGRTPARHDGKKKLRMG